MSGEAEGQDVSFLESLVPALEAGEYRVSVKQKLENPRWTRDGDKVDETWTGARRIAVSGERFTLAPGSIQSCFPAANSRGEYSGVLPHLVLSSLTLPWQRDPGGGGGQPWLALLVFKAGDPAPQPLMLKVGDLQHEPFARKPGAAEEPSGLPASTASYADGYKALKLAFAPEYGQSLADPCVAIDVPVALFAEIAPSLGDLPWLTHARTVPVGAKAGEPAGTYSVVVANRRIKGDEPCTVHLVSLEGLEKFLPADKTYSPASIQTEGGPASTVRLLSLYSWSFTPIEPAESFRGLLTNLHCGSLRRPRAKAAGAASESVDNAFGLGYTAIDHATRQGDSTVSWYRGPLLPLAAPSPSISSPIDSADQLLRYEPGSGMFDVSYAAAWQLGRLLGLQSKPFSVALYDWRRKVARAVASAPDEEGRLAARAAAEPPAAVTEWLAKLRLLYGVPFSYLVADEGLLEKESIRFFQLDPNWCDALVEGASSIGRTTSGDRRHDAVLVPRLRAAARRLAPSIRDAGAEAEAASPISGFLLRSAVVSGWPGLEVMAFSTTSAETPLKVLRMEHLAPGLMLFVVEGQIDHVQVHEPAESLHFGLEDEDRKEELRYVTGTTPQTEPGTTFKAGVATSVRAGGALEVEDLATKMQAQLNAQHANDNAAGNPRGFSSAEFALQMIEGAEFATLVNRPPEPSE